MNYRTNRSTRFAGLLIAVLMTVVVNGVMLWKFDAAAHEGALSKNAPTASAIVAKQVGTAVAQS